jgi:hypothetical protein
MLTDFPISVEPSAGFMSRPSPFGTPQAQTIPALAGTRAEATA